MMNITVTATTITILTGRNASSLLPQLVKMCCWWRWSTTDEDDDDEEDAGCCIFYA